MHIDWNHFTPLSALAGGVLIGLAAAMFVLFNGRIAGISGIIGGVFRPKAGSAGGLAEGEKSLAIRLTLGSDSAALADADIESAVQGILQSLADKTGARLR